MAVVQTYNLNIIPESSPVVVNVNQYDKGEGRFVFNLFDGDVPYVPAAAAVGEIQGTKPDGKGFLYYVKSISGNAVTCDLNMQMSAVEGKTRAQLLIHEPTGETGTFVFWIKVQDSALPYDHDLSESDYGLVEDMIAAAEQASSQIAFGVENAEAWATGERDGEPVVPGDETYHNNSKYYAQNANDDASDAEAFAAGTRDGVPVTSGDPAYHNNSLYYLDQQTNFTDESEAWAKGTREGQAVPSTDPAYNNNSKYYSEQAAASASTASTKASEASASASTASTKAGEASASASAAATSETNAQGYASNASDSATAAAGSASTASTKAGEAAQSATNASASATAASESASTASTKASEASASASDSEDSALVSEGYALGKQNGTDVASGSPYYENNSKYYAGQAGSSATAASGSASTASTKAGEANASATAADESAKDSEAYAIGKRGGTDVPSTDPAYHNNSKYYAEQVGAQAKDAEAWAAGTRDGLPIPSTDPAYHNNAKYYAGEIGDQVEDSEAWANGTRGGEPVPSTDPAYHNNAKYWSEQAAGTSFAGLEDVAIDESTLATGQVPKYNATSGKWENGNVDLSVKADKVSGATSGNFAGLDANGNLTDSGHKHSDYLTQHQDISGKADKVTGATNGNFAALDSNGNLTDSGHKHSDYYATGDTAETDLVDTDYVPFYDTSASAKRKTLWSNIKSVLKSYFDGLYRAVGSIYSNEVVVALNPTVTLDASLGDLYANKANAPTVLTATLATPNTQVTFQNAAITANAKIQVFTNVPGLNYESMDASTANTIVLTYEAQNTNVTVMLVIS